MCLDAARMIADAASRVAAAEWDLIQSINAEKQFHPQAVAQARKVLVARGDQMALTIFDQVMGREPDLEQARALVEER